MLRRLIIFAVCICLILLMQGCSLILALSEKSEPQVLGESEILGKGTQQEVESTLGRSFFSVKQGDGSRIETYDWSYNDYISAGSSINKKVIDYLFYDLTSFGLMELFMTPMEVRAKNSRSNSGGVERITVHYAPDGQILNVFCKLNAPLQEVDDHTIQDVTIIPIDATLTGMVVDDSSIWTIGFDTKNFWVFRVDRLNKKVIAKIPIVGKISAIAMGEGAVWVTHVKSSEDKASSHRGFVSKIDPKTNTVISEIPVGKNPSGISIGKDAVWIANSDDGTVSRINSKTNEVFSAIRVGEKPTSIAVSEDAVWVANYGNGTISRIDPLTNMVVTNIPIGKNPSLVRIGEGFIWVISDGDVTIFRIDPRTNKVLGETISLNKKLISMYVSGGALSLANYEDGIVLIFDPNTLLVNGKPIFIAPSKLKGDMLIEGGITYIISSDKGSPSPSNLLQLIIPRDEKVKTFPPSKL
jgi:YVTN family beta-propeller protein